MPDILDANGLQVKTLNDIIADLVAGVQTIYGPDVNVNQNSPDGQLINIFAQAAVDIRELLVNVNSSFDPDQAVGVVLDERVVINNIQRQGGTFTVQPIEITTDRTVNLQGLDAAYNDPNGTGYTVSDDSGNQFILIDTVTLTAGTDTLNFRAKNIGLVETTPNTIINPVTIVLGVTDINNPSGALQIGQNEETDAQLRVRRQQSVSNGAIGYLDALLGSLLAITGVTDGKVYENNTDATDSDGIPEHSIWAIVEGGANTDIANVIYSKLNYGAGMKGTVSVPITTASGAVMNIKFDRPTAENLYIRFDIQKTSSIAVFDQALIKQYIVDNMKYTIGQFAQVANLYAAAVAAINANGGGGFPTELQISTDNITYVDYILPSTLDKQFVLDTTRISITELP